jgi:hypothetical protein
MKYLDFILKSMNLSQWILLIIFILYFILGEPMPTTLGIYLSTKIGKIIVVLLALCLFSYTNIYLAIFGLFIAYSLITNPKANEYYSSSDWSQAYPKEKQLYSPFSADNQFSYTLEQEIVKKMTAPHKAKLDKQKYKSMIDSLHNAAPVNYDGLI